MDDTTLRDNARADNFQATDIRKTYVTGDQHIKIEVLKGIDLRLDRGNTVAIVGVSGTGKTTLLHILGTLDRPSSGTITHNGQDLFTKNEIELSAYRNREIGFVFQFHNLLPEFTAVENVMMPGLIAGLTREQMADEAHHILTRVGLTNRSTHLIGELSGGEQQRVALGRALIMKPTLLIADEPTGNLDIKTGMLVFELLQEMSAAYSLATIMATHNLELAGRMNRCLTLADGRLHE